MTVGTDPGHERFPGESGRAHARLCRALLADLRHDNDLAQLALAAPRRWSDALVAETRFHLAGMMNALELAIGLHIADPRVEAMLGELGPGYCRQAIEHRLDLLSPEFVGHIRRRAAIALLLRLDELSGARSSLSALGQIAMNEAYAGALTALVLAERRWCAPMLIEAPMRPDLPAEQYHDLAWTVAAILIQGTEAQGGGDPILLKGIAQATERLIGRHDEGQGGFALARRCARSLPREARLSLAPAALVDARLLLFAALAEGEIGLEIEQIVDTMIDPADEPRLAVLRLMGIDDAVAFRAAELLAPLNGLAAEGDAGLAAFVERYRQFDAGRAVAWLARMSSPPALTEKLALMDRLQ